MRHAPMITGLAVLAGLFTTAATAGGSSYIDYARVQRVEPIVRVVRVQTPRRECWDEEVTRYQTQYEDRDSYTPAILGGIIGGVVGNQVGRGHGRDALTIAGTLLGASVGRDIGRHRRVDRPYADVERRCAVTTDVHEEERTEGYRVTYRYQGNAYTQRMDHDPGRRIKVRVSVEPLDY